jgi:hypothetical protein
MEGMTILRVLLAVLAVIFIGALIYWIGNGTANDNTKQDSKTQQPTFPAAAMVTQGEPTEPVEPQHPEIIKYVSSVKIHRKKSGGILGCIGCAMTACLCLSYIITSEITVLQAQMINAYTLTVIAAVLSMFGTFFHDASCVLLASIALVSAFFLDMSTVFGLIPAIVLVYSYERMKHNIDIDVKKKELER